jgi:hypothetical protein
VAKHRLASIAAAVAVAIAPLAARSGGAPTLYGDTVHGVLTTEATGGFDGPADVVVGENTEFARDFPPYATLSLNVLPNGFSLAYSGTQSIGEGGFNAGLISVELSDLDFSNGDVVIGVQPLASNWPVDALQPITFGPHSISVGFLGASINAGDDWAANFAILSPEPGAAATGAVAALALAALRRARYSRSGGVTRAIQSA